MTLSENRSAAVALYAGTAAGLVTMALHPSGREVLQNASQGGSNTLVTAVHGLALVGQGLVLTGALAITDRLRGRRDLAVAGYVFFALSAVAVLVAAAASGFLAPSVVRGLDSADPNHATAMSTLHYTGLINQAFAKINVLFAGIALLLWSAAMLIGKEFTRALAVYGAVLAVVMLAGTMSGLLRLNIHGYGMVVLGQGLWLVGAGTQLWSGRAGER